MATTTVPASGGSYSFTADQGTQEFLFTPDVSGNVTIQTTGTTNADTYIDLYTLPGVNFVTDDDSSGQDGTHGKIVASLTAGVNYVSYVYCFPAGATFAYTVTFEAGGTVVTPDSTNDTVYESANNDYSSVLAPSDPKQTETIPYHLASGGTLWFQYTVQVNISDAQPSRADGTSIITVTNGATMTLWKRPVAFLTTFAEYDAIIAKTPDYGPGLTTVSLVSSFDPEAWIVKVSLPAGSGEITFTGPLWAYGDEKYIYYSDWYDPAKDTSIDPTDPYFGIDGYVLYGDNAITALTPSSPLSGWVNKRDIKHDDINATQSDVIEGPSGGGGLIQYSYAQVTGAGRVWHEEQAGFHYCSLPLLTWWETAKNDPGIKDLFGPHPLETGLKAKPWAVPVPTEPVIPFPWVPGQAGWVVEWDYSTMHMVDLTRFIVTETSYSPDTRTTSKVEYYREIGKLGTADMSTLYPHHGGEMDARVYKEEHPGLLFQAGRVNTFLGTFAEVDGTQVSFAPDKHGPYMDFIYPDNMLIGQSIGWDIVTNVGYDIWIRTPRYRYRRLYIRPIPVANEGGPPMRQRHRNDGLATDAREFKGHGSSQQISIFRGGRTYY